MTPQEIESQVRDFIFQYFHLAGENSDLSNHVSLLESGVVDSTGILELVAFLEETYRIVIENEDLVPSNLDSVNNIVSFVRRKLGI